MRMPYVVIAALIVSGCGYQYSWEQELQRWYQQQIMWEKYNQVQLSKRKNPAEKVEAVRSEQLERMWRASQRPLQSEPEPRRVPDNSGDRLIQWASRRPSEVVQQSSIIDLAPKHKVVPREDLKVGERYLYFPANGSQPYPVEIIFAQYRSTFGIVNMIKWVRVFDSGRRGEIETSKTGTFKTIHLVAPRPPDVVYEPEDTF